MNCPKCGEQVTEGAAFCWACEAALGKVRLPPQPAAPPPSPQKVSTPYSTVGKSEEVIGFALFMIGGLWSCGATAAAQTQAQADYTWPFVLMAAGVLFYIYGRIKARRHARKETDL